MLNVEFKAELRDLALARTICRAIRATHIATLRQTDTYYRIPSGRLKKRECDGEPVEYIYYDRANRSLPKLSLFNVFSERQARERYGEAELPIWLIVRKTRELFIIDNVRIHLDRVDGLGEFIEFEAVVSRTQPVAKCHRDLASLRERLGPAIGEPIAMSYSDMLADGGEGAVGESTTPPGPLSAG
jgi:adenylate cyclase class IV